VGNIDLKVISIAENSNKFQKTRFWKEKSVEHGDTWADGTSYTSISNKWFRTILIATQYGLSCDLKNGLHVFKMI